jgi:hypothetical protein
MASNDSGWAYSDDDDGALFEDEMDEYIDDEDEEVLQEIIDKHFAGIPKYKIMIALKDYYPDYF